MLPLLTSVEDEWSNSVDVVNVLEGLEGALSPSATLLSCHSVALVVLVDSLAWPVVSIATGLSHPDWSAEDEGLPVKLVMALPLWVSEMVDEVPVEAVLVGRVSVVLVHVILIVASVVMDIEDLDSLDITWNISISELPASSEEVAHPVSLVIDLNGGGRNESQAKLSSNWHPVFSPKSGGILRSDPLVWKRWVLVEWLVKANEEASWSGELSNSVSELSLDSVLVALWLWVAILVSTSQPALLPASQLDLVLINHWGPFDALLVGKVNVVLVGQPMEVVVHPGEFTIADLGGLFLSPGVSTHAELSSDWLVEVGTWGSSAVEVVNFIVGLGQGGEGGVVWSEVLGLGEDLLNAHFCKLFVELCLKF